MYLRIKKDTRIILQVLSNPKWSERLYIKPVKDHSSGRGNESEDKWLKAILPLWKE